MYKIIQAHNGQANIGNPGQVNLPLAVLPNLLRERVLGLDSTFSVTVQSFSTGWPFDAQSIALANSASAMAIKPTTPVAPGSCATDGLAVPVHAELGLPVAPDEFCGVGKTAKRGQVRVGAIACRDGVLRYIKMIAQSVDEICVSCHKYLEN